MLTYCELVFQGSSWENHLTLLSKYNLWLRVRAREGQERQIWGGFSPGSENSCFLKIHIMVPFWPIASSLSYAVTHKSSSIAHCSSSSAWFFLILDWMSKEPLVLDSICSFFPPTPHWHSHNGPWSLPPCKSSWLLWRLLTYLGHLTSWFGPILVDCCGCHIAFILRQTSWNIPFKLESSQDFIFKQL